MIDITTRLGGVLIAAALLFAAARLHRASGKHPKISKPAGVIMAFISGCAFLASIAGDWVGSIAIGAVGVAGLIACIVVLVADWALDGRPDRPAFIAALLLPAFLMFGGSQIPVVVDLIGDGTGQVSEQIVNQIESP